MGLYAAIAPAAELLLLYSSLCVRVLVCVCTCVCVYIHIIKYSEWWGFGGFCVALSLGQRRMERDERRETSQEREESEREGSRV